MFDDAVETIEVDDTTRVTLHYDDNPENPRTAFDPITSARTVDELHHVIDVGNDDFPGDLDRAHQELWHFGRNMYANAYNPGGDTVARWARIFYGITIVTDYDGTSERGTWWWVEPEKMAEAWPELEQGSPEYVAKEIEAIDSDITEYQAWAEGHVYGIALEKRETWVKLGTEEDHDPETRTDWEIEESCWGFYINDNYTFEQAAREHGYIK